MNAFLTDNYLGKHRMVKRCVQSCSAGKWQRDPSWLFSTFTTFFLRLFSCGPFVKSFLNLLQWRFYVLVFWPWGMWDLSSQTGDQTRTPCIGRWRLNHGTIREVATVALLLSPGFLAIAGQEIIQNFKAKQRQHSYSSISVFLSLPFLLNQPSLWPWRCIPSGLSGKPDSLGQAVGQS